MGKRYMGGASLHFGQSTLQFSILYTDSNHILEFFKPLESCPKHPQTPQSLEYPSPAVDPRYLR